MAKRMGYTGIPGTVGFSLVLADGDVRLPISGGNVYVSLSGTVTEGTAESNGATFDVYVTHGEVYARFFVLSRSGFPLDATKFLSAFFGLEYEVGHGANVTEYIAWGDMENPTESFLYSYGWKIREMLESLPGEQNVYTYGAGRTNDYPLSSFFSISRMAVFGE